METSKNGKKRELKIDYGQKMLSYAPVYIMFITLLGNILSYIAHLTKNLTNGLIESAPDVGFKNNNLQTTHDRDMSSPSAKQLLILTQTIAAIHYL